MPVVDHGSGRCFSSFFPSLYHHIPGVHSHSLNPDDTLTRLSVFASIIFSLVPPVSLSISHPLPLGWAFTMKGPRRSTLSRRQPFRSSTSPASRRGQSSEPGSSLDPSVRPVGSPGPQSRPQKPQGFVLHTPDRFAIQPVDSRKRANLPFILDNLYTPAPNGKDSTNLSKRNPRVAYWLWWDTDPNEPDGASGQGQLKAIPYDVVGDLDPGYPNGISSPSALAGSPSRRRRNPARSSTHVLTYSEEMELEEAKDLDEDIQDTIQVAGSDVGDSYSYDETPSSPSAIPMDPMLMSDDSAAAPETLDQELPPPLQTEEQPEPMPIDPAMIDPVMMGSNPEAGSGTVEGGAAAEDKELKAAQQLPLTAADGDGDDGSDGDAIMHDDAQPEPLKPKEEEVEDDAGLANGIQASSSSDAKPAEPEATDYPELPLSEDKQEPDEASINVSTMPEETLTTAPSQKSSVSPRMTRSSPPTTRARTGKTAERKSSIAVAEPTVADRLPEENSSQIREKQSGLQPASKEKSQSAEETIKVDQEPSNIDGTLDLAAQVRKRLAEKSAIPKKTSSLQSAVQQDSRPQPRPTGRWSHLTPYVDGEYTVYPEKQARSDDDEANDDKAEDKDANEGEPMVEDNDDAADTVAPTPALNTPRRGSPVPDSGMITAFGSPAPGAAEDVDDDNASGSDEALEKPRHFKYRKLRDADDYINALEDHEDMSTEDLYNVLEAINLSMVQWQTEWNNVSRMVDDYENAQRRRIADTKYESRTRNLHQHNVNWEEPDFVIKGYKAKEKEMMSETRYLQAQDRIMAASYGFDYDPHPSKIGKQNPELQQQGMVTRGRMLRNQPKQTVKASEGDEPTGKRQRKPVQLFDPATQDLSRSSTPAPTRGRRRKNAQNEVDEAQQGRASSPNGVGMSDDEGSGRKARRRRGPRAKADLAESFEEPNQASDQMSLSQEEPTRSARRGRGRPGPRYDGTYPQLSVQVKSTVLESKDEPRRHLLTLRVPKDLIVGETRNAFTDSFTDHVESRPSTASSESSSHTVESSYSFRPKRQKRFRDEPEESPPATQAPTKKRRIRNSTANYEAQDGDAMSINTGSHAHALGGSVAAMPQADTSFSESPTTPVSRKPQKIKVVRAPTATSEASRYGTPTTLMSFNSEDGDEPPKDYKSMTKSEKMSASMKSKSMCNIFRPRTCRVLTITGRWANGNMAGAVEKRKATLAAKKAAQAAAEQKVGQIAPKPQSKKPKKEGPALQPHPPPQQQHQQQQQQQQHLHHHHQPIQPMQMQMHHHHHHHHQQPPVQLAPHPGHPHQHPQQQQQQQPPPHAQQRPPPQQQQQQQPPPHPEQHGHMHGFPMLPGWLANPFR